MFRSYVCSETLSPQPLLACWPELPLNVSSYQNSQKILSWDRSHTLTEKSSPTWIEPVPHPVIRVQNCRLRPKSHDFIVNLDRDYETCNQNWESTIDRLHLEWTCLENIRNVFPTGLFGQLQIYTCNPESESQKLQCYLKPFSFPHNILGDCWPLGLFLHFILKHKRTLLLRLRPSPFENKLRMIRLMMTDK